MFLMSSSCGERQKRLINNPVRKFLGIFWAMLIFGVAFLSAVQLSAAEWKFDFVSHPGLTNSFSKASGHGIDLGTSVSEAREGGVMSDKPFFFSITAREGNYRVTATLGDKTAATTNYVKAEARRLMLENVRTAKGEFVTRSFNVNTRTVEYPGGKVHLKPREVTTEAVTWDDKLTLEFSGPRVVLRSLEIASATNVTTVFIAGDSTVCDQPLEPWNSWGQMLPRFFDESVAVANYAESGESIKSSLGAHRFDKIWSVIQPGDYLFVQFGHNDMKDKATNALAVYKSNLEKIVATARAHGATPVLVTSMERKAGVNGPTLAGYPETVREVAHEQGTALIDLNAMSVKFYKARGADIGLAFQDGTHHNNYGSYELARCVVEGIRDNKLALAQNLAADAVAFDPAKPDDVKTFFMPASPQRDPAAKPEGN
jgi:lysophospholipase L1-like esterase